MEKLMTEQKRDSEAWFFDLLKRAGEIEVSRLLESEEALEAFLKSNPLSASEEEFVRQAVARIAARFRGEPVAPHPTPSDETQPVENTAFAVLHRKQGKMTEDVEKKLDGLRKQARSKSKGKSGRKGAEPDRDDRGQ